MMITYPLPSIAFALIMMSRLPSTTQALNSTSEACCRVYPDPHFQTWHGDWYDFHGGCDLVLIKSTNLTLHIRTEDFGGWSGTTDAAVQIGTDILEVKTSPDQVLKNNVAVATFPTTIGGYNVTTVASPVSYNIHLDGAQYCRITRSYSNTLQVECCAHGSYFGDATAMCGHWVADSPNNLVARNGTYVYPYTDTVGFGEEWQVSSPTPDPALLTGPSNENCTSSLSFCQRFPCNFCDQEKDPECQEQRCDEPGDPDCESQVPTGAEGRRLQTPEEECANVTEAFGYRENCIYDINTTGNLAWARQDAYVNPLVVIPTLCEDDAEKKCESRGGSCVWRCDESETDCEPSLCSPSAGFEGTEGCSCAIPRKTDDCDISCDRIGLFPGIQMHLDFIFCLPLCVPEFLEGFFLKLIIKCGGCD